MLKSFRESDKDECIVFMVGGGDNVCLVKIRQMNKILGFLHDEHSLEFFIIDMDES